LDSQLILITDPDTNFRADRERTLVKTTLAGEIDLVVSKKDDRYLDHDLFVLTETEALVLAHDLIDAVKALAERRKGR
jgi:hypothetical protein